MVGLGQRLQQRKTPEPTLQRPQGRAQAAVKCVWAPLPCRPTVSAVSDTASAA